MRAALRYGTIALATPLFLQSLRRSGEPAGRLAERLKIMEKANDVQHRMLEAAARRPRDHHELAERLTVANDRKIDGHCIVLRRPTQNALTESFNGRLRGELLSETLLPSLHHSRAALAAWHKGYNAERPHPRLGCRRRPPMPGLSPHKGIRPRPADIIGSPTHSYRQKLKLGVLLTLD